MIGPKAEKKPKQIPAKNRIAVEERSGGVCEWCGIARATDIHHRQYRSRGGTHDVHNLLHLCGPGNAGGCHGVAHSGGEQVGLSVPSGMRPEMWPVLYRQKHWVLLTDEPDHDGLWHSKPFSESVATLLMQGGRA